ncbi:MAG: ArnT family glycosyltransferase [Acidobacteriaceae bacterium]
MTLIRRYRLPALFCALAVLVCELVSRPYAGMGVCDDGPYILMAQHLARTGHIAYNGWAAPMLGWQLYLGAALIKLFGFSYSTVRMSTVLVAAAVAWLLQRTLARAGISERNATLGTLAFVLSPLYLMLAATYMTDIFGLLAVVICLYGCLRALQADSERAAVAWLCFAVASNAIFGTARQIAWLGILVMVPCTLYLLGSHGAWRSRLRVLGAGAGAALAGALFILGCMEWLKRQPYLVAEPLLPASFPVAHVLGQFSYLLLDTPFLLLPLFAVFAIQLRRAPARVLAGLGVLFCGYLFLALYPSHLRGYFPLEPMLFNGNWVSVHGIYEGVVSLSDWRSTPPLFLHTGDRVILTLASLGGVCGLLCGAVYGERALPAARGAGVSGSGAGAKGGSAGLSGGSAGGARQERRAAEEMTWRSLDWLLGPFCAAYVTLLLPRSTGEIFDRYMLPMLMLAALALVRRYQQSVSAELPMAAAALVALMAIYGVAVTHNMFSLYRARVALADELRAKGVPGSAVDGGWEYNLNVELRHADHLNSPGIRLPADAYRPTPAPPAGICQMLWYDETPHIHPLYGVSFQPDVCAGPAPFAPVHYSRWLAGSPGTLYAVRYVPAAELPPGMP